MKTLAILSCCLLLAVGSIGGCKKKEDVAEKPQVEAPAEGEEAPESSDK